MYEERLRRGTIHVWRFSAGAATGADVALLDASERARAARFVDPAIGASFATGRATLRRLLARYVGLLPDALRLAAGVHGRPALVGADVPHVSWGRSGAHWVLAVAADGAVGVDIERIDVALDWREPAGIAFHPDEVLFVEQGPALARFYAVWTRKEALFKAIGIGLHDDMARVVLLDDRGQLVERLRCGDDGLWHLRGLLTPPGLAAALASRFTPLGVVERSYDAMEVEDAA